MHTLKLLLLALLASSKRFLAKLKRVFTEVEAGVKAAGATVIGGGVNAVIHELHVAGTFAWDLEHLMALKASFLGGMFTALFFYLMEFPPIREFVQRTGNPEQ